MWQTKRKVFWKRLIAYYMMKSQKIKIPKELIFQIIACNLWLKKRFPWKLSKLASIEFLYNNNF